MDQEIDSLLRKQAKRNNRQMPEKRMPDSYKLYCYAEGICCSSVCTSLEPKEAERVMNQLYPTGIGSKWKISKDKTFKTGEANGCACEDKPETHKHYLFVC